MGSFSNKHNNNGAQSYKISKLIREMEIVVKSTTYLIAYALLVFPCMLASLLLQKKK